MEFQFSKNQPLTINTYDDKFFFRNLGELSNYDIFLFSGQPVIKGGCTYTSWNEINIIIHYGDDIWNQLSKVNFIKASVDGTETKQYYYVTNYSIIQKNKIMLTCVLDVITTYLVHVVFKKGTFIHVDRMHAYRWTSNTSKKIANNYYLTPDWRNGSPLWTPDFDLLKMDNKIIEKNYPLNRIMAPQYQTFYYATIKGQFIYFVFKYNTDNEFNKLRYLPPGIDNVTPMPFFIHILEGNSIEFKTYQKYIDNPFLQGIYCSQFPWFDFTTYPPGHDFTYEEKQLNPLVYGVDWKKTWNEDLPDPFNQEKQDRFFRADIIPNFFKLRNTLDFTTKLGEYLDKEIINNNFGFIKEKEVFSVRNEPKLYMFPFFELDYLKGKRQPLVLHNERLFSGELFNQDLIIHFLEVFTPYYISTYRFPNQGLYRSGTVDMKYSLDLSGANTLISLTSPMKQFLNDYLSNYATGLSLKQNNKDFQWGKFFAGIGGGAVGGAVAGSMVPGIGTAIGGVVGGVLGLFNGINGFNQTEAELQQQKNQLIDLARQPDSVNGVNNNETYLDTFLAQLSDSQGIIRTRELTYFDKEKIAFYFHKFGYPINNMTRINNLQSLMTRETWNYIKVENLINAIDLEKSNIPWKALDEINNIFRKGIRLWYIFDFNSENKLFDYNLPNWETDIIWDLNPNFVLKTTAVGKFLKVDNPNISLNIGDKISFNNNTFIDIAPLEFNYNGYDTFKFISTSKFIKIRSV